MNLSSEFTIHDATHLAVRYSTFLNSKKETQIDYQV